MNMEPGILTTTLQSFIKDFSNGWVLLQPTINFLIKVFLGIEIVMIGLWMALGGIDNLVGVMKKFLYLLVWAWIIKEYPTLTDAFIQSLVQAGVIAGGGAIGNTNIFDPSSIISLGFNNMGTVFDELGGPGALLFSSSALVICVCLILSLLAYIIIAWQIFYSILEFYLISALTGLFLPFGFFEPTKFLAEKAIGAVVSSGIKLMVLAFIVTVSTPVLHNLSLPHALALKEAATSLLIVGALAFLCWNAPGVAAGLMSGSPSLSAGVAYQNAVAAGGVVATAALGAAKSVGGALFNAVKAATTSHSDSNGKNSGEKVGNGAGRVVGAALKQSSKVAGQAVQKAGEGVSAAGKGMKSAGEQIAATPIPVVSQVAGAVVGAAGAAADLAGKGISAAGKGIEKAGDVAGKAAEKSAEKSGESAGNVTDKTAVAAEKAAVSADKSDEKDVKKASALGNEKKDKSSDWAMDVLKAMQNTPEEAKPLGGGVEPRL
jgi:type IV secretion system protein TrbL